MAGNEYILIDAAGWGGYARFTHYPSGDTLLYKRWMDDEEWARAVVAYLGKYPGLMVRREGHQVETPSAAMRLSWEAQLLIGHHSFTLCLGGAELDMRAKTITVRLEGDRLEHHYGAQATVVMNAKRRELYTLLEPLGGHSTISDRPDGGQDLVFHYE
jgi:hypothetical protein